MIINRYTEIRAGFLISLQLHLCSFNKQQESVHICTKDKRPWTQVATKEIPTRHKEKPFHNKSGSVLVPAAHRSCSTLFLEVKIIIKSPKWIDMTEVGLALEQYIELESSFPTWITVYPCGFGISLCWWIAGIKQECKQVPKNRMNMVKTWHLLERDWGGRRWRERRVKHIIFPWLCLIGVSDPSMREARQEPAGTLITYKLIPSQDL